MNEACYKQPLDTYLPRLIQDFPALEDLYLKNRLFICIYPMKERLIIQDMSGAPDAEFGLIAGQRIKRPIPYAI